MTNITIYNTDYKTLSMAADLGDTTIAEIIGEMVYDREHDTDYSDSQDTKKAFYFEYAKHQIEEDRKAAEKKKSEILHGLKDAISDAEDAIQEVNGNHFYISCHCMNAVRSLMEALTEAQEVIGLYEKISMVEKLL